VDVSYLSRTKTLLKYIFKVILRSPIVRKLVGIKLIIWRSNRWYHWSLC